MDFFFLNQQRTIFMFIVLFSLFLNKIIHFPGPGVCVDAKIFANPSLPLIKKPLD